jgi:hypothetical protein
MQVQYVSRPALSHVSNSGGAPVILKDLMLHIKNILESNNIRYILDCGTLLKAYRNNLLDVNDDQDFAIYRDDLDKVRELLKNDPILKPILRIKKEWPNEISVFLNSEDKNPKEFAYGHQIDFYRYDYDDVYCYHYWYERGTDGKWETPYRIRFPKVAYFPLKRMSFIGASWIVPNDPETKFVHHYGPDWRTPKKQFYGIASIPCVDRTWDTKSIPISKGEEVMPEPVEVVKPVEYAGEYDQRVAVMMTTFLRDDLIMTTMSYYLQFPYRMYVIDQGRHTDEKNKFYTVMRAKGHVIEYADYDCGVSRARNLCLKLTKEPYILVHDDDQWIREKIDPQIELLQRHPKIGLVSGTMLNHISNQMQTYNYSLRIENNVLYYEDVKDNIPDTALNFFVAKREMFNDIQWDEKLKLVEHTDFFLTLKHTQWKVLYDPTFVGDHFPVKTGEYRTLRSRPVFLAMFKQKHQLRKIIKDGKLI